MNKVTYPGMLAQKERKSQRYSDFKYLKMLHTLACPYHLEEMGFIEKRKTFSHRKKKKKNFVKKCKQNYYNPT